MSTAGAEAPEPPATVFDDDDGSVSSTDDDVADDDEQDDEAAPPLQPPTQAAAAPTPAAPTPPNPVSTTRSASDQNIAVSSAQNGTIAVLPVAALTASSDLSTPSSVPASAFEDRKPLAIAYDESRRLFQRLWTDEDEIKILQGFLEFTSKRGTTFASHQHDTGPFYEEIKKQLNLDFTKNQLIEKLRRLKKKFRNCCTRMHSAGSDFQFKSAHERSIYDIAKNIWDPSFKRARDSDDEEMAVPCGVIPNSGNQIITVPINEGSFSSGQRGSSRASRRRMRRRYAEGTAAATMPTAAAVPAAAAVPSATGPASANFDNSKPVMQTPISSLPGVPSVVEETVKSCLSPLFKELINSAISGGPFAPGLAGSPALFSMLPLSLGGSVAPVSGMPADAKWREQQILELEVYLKRMELMREQIKMTLEELKSSRS